jgi:dethiobiotin synthetase
MAEAPSTSRTTVLVTGTDTGIGKTWVACALARALVRTGRSVVAVKPVETGCGERPAPTEDGVRLASAAGQRAPRHALRRFRAPVTPALAADLEGASLDLDELAGEIEAASGTAEVLLIEGAGGLLSPLGWDWNAVDLAQALQATALVVTSDRLGSINHTLLTLSALDLAGIRVAAILVGAPSVPDPSTGTNAEPIARLSGIGRVRVVPWVAEPDPAAPWLVEVAGWL